MGEEGGIYISNGTSYNFQLHKKGRFPLWCGDAFIVEVTYGKILKFKPKDILNLAVRTGYFASTVKGSSTSIVFAASKISNKI